MENTPARILFTQHHGSGNNYRQCFYNKAIDFRKYDSLFYSARAQEKTDVIADLVFSRLLYPAGLTEEARQTYEDYIREHVRQTAEYLINVEDISALKEFTARRFWTAETLGRSGGVCGLAGEKRNPGFSYERKASPVP